MGVGIAGYFSLGQEPPFWVGTAGLSLSLLVLWLIRRRHAPLAVLPMVAVALLFLGFAAAQWRTASVAAPVLARAVGPTTVEGRVVHVEPKGRGLRVTLERARIGGIGPAATPEKVRVGLQGRQPAIRPGDWIRLRARLTPPPPPAAPGAYDFQRRFFFQGIGAVGFSYGAARVLPGGEGGMAPDPMRSLLEGVSRLRNTIGERVVEAFPAERQGTVAAVTRALMTGERGAIDRSVLDDFRDSGIAHLLAISGLHIGLVAGIVFFGLRALLALSEHLALHYPIKKWAALAALFAAFGYALIAGATVPTMRAFLMIGVVLAAILFDRRGLSLRLIAFAACVILLFKPESLLGASFQLSFAAVTALVAAYEGLSGSRWGRRWAGRGWVWTLFAYVGGVALTTVIAGVATGPFAAYHFNRFADYGLAANLLAVPLTGLWIMPWAVAAFVLMPFGLEGLALAPMGAGVSLVLDIAGEVASWPGAVTLLPAMPAWALAAVTFGGLWMCLWRRPWRWAGVGAVVAGMLSLNWTVTPDILIDEKGRLAAVKTGDGLLAVSSLQTAKFNREIWFRRAAQREPLTFRDTAAAANPVLACDGIGCIYKAKGRTVALVRHAAALDEDCRRAHVVISSVPLRRSCPGPGVVVDRFDLWRKGTHALWLEADGRVRIETVNGVRGKRPWVLWPTRRPARETPPDA